jgi:thiol-disulfide isomerase/thioredoxin
MLRMNAVGWLGLLIAAATAAARADEGPFRALTFDQAKRAAAERGDRFVLVDFFTTWCGPCKKLDETTWKDREVRDWLAKEAVCIKVDAEKDTALADKYRINVYPTVLLIRPDGAEIDRLVGYRDAPTFLADARDSLAGKDTLSRARRKLVGSAANNPSLRVDYGDALAQKGRLEDALSEYLWCFDHGLEHDVAFTGVRLSFLLNRIVQLGRSHPPALDELRKRRDAARQALEGGKADPRTAMDVAALNRELGEPEQTLSLYDRIKDNKSLPASVRQVLFDRSLDQLLKARRYKEIVAATDARAKVRQGIARHEMTRRMAPNDADLHAFMKRQVSVDGAKYYEASIGAGDKAGADRVAAMLVEFDPSGAYPELIAAAKRAGDARAAEELTRESRKPKPAASR